MHGIDDAPYPPANLRRRVHGADDLESFVGVGKAVAGDLERHLLTAELGCRDARVLDFGCGCGRVLRFLARDRGWRIHACDVDAEAISWCRLNLAQRARFSTNAPAPPLPYPAGFFDFVYSISVFTHLPEDLQLGWLEELRRVTRPGGHLLLSTHGEGLFHLVSRRGRRTLREHGFYYCAIGKTEGLPDFYQTSFHHRRYIERQWSRFFEIVRIEENGIAGRQDAILCRRPETVG
jgi:SAM-dependent methyltransferase